MQHAVRFPLRLSPTLSPSAKYSSTSPRNMPKPRFLPTSLIFSIGASTMVPIFIRNAAAVSSTESKEKFYAKALHILTETEMPVVPLYLGTEYCLLQKKVRHFPLNILGQLPLRGVTLE